ncbi:Ig-like domain-containing protein, partial [Spirosoma sp. 48-14]
MNRLLYVILLFLGFGYSNLLFATDKYWTGATNNDWNTASNWNPSGVPSSTERVYIYSTANNPVIYSGTNATSLVALVSGSGVTLTINSGGTHTGQIAVEDGGLITNNGTANIQAVGGGVLDGNGITYYGAGNVGSIVNNSTMNINVLYNSFYVFNYGTFTNSSTGVINSNGAGFIANVGTFSLSNSGTITHSGSDMGIGSGTSLTNNACGKFIVSANYYNDGTGSTVNNGLIQIAGALNNSSSFTNNGVLSYGSLSGSITKNNGSVIVNNNPTNSTIFTYTGTFTGTINGIYTNANVTTLAGTFTAPNTFVPSGLSAGSQTLYAKIIPSGGGCTYIVPFTYVMASAPNFTINPTSKTVCSNSGTTFTVAASNYDSYQWQVNTGGGFTDISNSTPYSGVTTGTLTISNVAGLNGYQYRCVATNSGGSTNSTAATLTVLPGPGATISYAGTPFCASSPAVNVTQTGTTGGTYSASPNGLNINPNTGQITPASSTTGTYSVTYTIAASGGCTQFTTNTSVVISPTPNATISYAGSPFCLSGAAVNVTQTGTTGGTYSASPDGLSIDANTGQITPTSSTTGTYTVTYMVSAGSGCASFSTTTSVVISSASSAAIVYAGSPFCANLTQGAVTLTGPTGGTYSSSPTGLNIDPSTGQINPSQSTARTYTVTYTLSAGGGCSPFTTTQVTIATPPNATISYTGSPFCTSGTSVAVNRTGTGGGTYLASPSGLSINASTGRITPGSSAPGSYTVSYLIAGSNGCPDYYATTTITITEAPSATIAYAGSPFCGDGTVADVTLTGTPGGTFSASPSGLVLDGSTGQINPVGSSARTYTVTYRIAASGGCPQFTTTASAVVSSSISVTNPSTSTALQGSNVNLTFSATGGTFPYTYSVVSGSLPNGLTVSTDGALSGIPTQIGDFPILVQVTDANGCTKLGPNYNFTVIDAAPTVTNLAANPSKVCVGSPVTFTATIGRVTGSYNYTLTNGSSTSIAGTKTSTSFSQAITPGTTGTQTFSLIIADNGLTGSASTVVPINSYPVATLVNNGPLSCTQTSVTLTAGGGNNFVFSGPGLLSQDAASGLAEVTVSGLYSVTVTNTETGCSSTTTTTVSSNTAVVSVTNPIITTATVGTAFSQSFTASSGTAPLNFSITSGSLPTGLTLATTGVLSGTPMQSGSFSITVRATDANGCSGVGATYSLQVSTTATVTTAAPSSILGTSATLGGTITADGGTSVTERGVVYMTGSGTPTTSNTKVTMGSGTGSFSQTVSNLVSGTTYSVRAYAINVAGTSYGAVQSFTTISATSAPVVLTPANGSQLSNNRPTYTGTATPVSSVTVFVDDSYAGEINADAVGNWSFTPSVSLPDGTHRVFARAALNSLTSPNSNTNTFSIDTTPPPGPVVSTPNNGTTISDNTPTYAGTAEPLSTVTVRVNSSVIGTPTADASGNWSLTPTTPLADGLYTVRATATDPVGNTGPSSSTISFTVDTTSPTVSITSTAPNPTSTSPIPLTITFSETVSGFLIEDIKFTNGTLSDFTGSGSSYTVNVVPGTTGMVSVSVASGAAQDLAGNNNSASNLFSIQYSPMTTISDFTASPDPVCVGNQVTFTANLGNLTGSYTYTLTNGTSTTTGASSNTSFSQQLTTTASGIQAFSLTVSNNGQRVTETYDLTVSELPAATLTASNGGVLTCGQTSLTLTATGGDDYAFSGPGILNQDPENGIAVGNAPGTYSVTVTNTETGCFSSTTTTITSNTTSPSVSILPPASSTLTCTTTSISLTATGGGTYHWDNNSTNAIRTVTTGGTYSVTVTGSNGCTATASTEVSQSTTITGFSVTGSGTACAGGQVTLTASGCSGGTITWPGGITGAVFSTTISGQYTATCTIENCTATASGTATVGNIFTITTPGISTATVGASINNTLNWSVSGGSSPYTFNFGTLPPGLSVTGSSSAFRAIGGTPTQAGTFPISLTVTDNLGCAQV